MSEQFHFYRYQILPISQQRQLTLFDKQVSVEELRERKNQYFLAVLREIKEFEYRNHQTSYRKLYDEGEIVIIQIALDRGSVKQEKPDFTQERYQNFPSFIVGFNNNPTVQRILIEREYKAFRDSYLAIKMIQDNLNKALELYMLHVEINPIFDSNDFWELVSRFPSIYKVEFEMVAPNLTNLHGSIEDSIKNWFPATNSQTIDIEMKSDENDSLELHKGSEPVTSFVNYASQGGGNISIRRSGFSKKITTKDTVSTIEIKEGELEIIASGNVDVSRIIDVLTNAEKYLPEK